MTRLLLRKSLRESRWLLLGCVAAVFSFCWLRVWIVSRLSTDRFRAILEMLPGDWRRFLGVDFDWLITYQGRISLAYQELIVVLCVSIWSIARGSDVVSGELNRGTMEMLLAQPLSRSRILATQSCVAILGVAAISASAWLGTWTGIQTTQVKEKVRAQIDLPFYLPGVGNSVTLPLAREQTVHIPMREKVDPEIFLPASINLFSLGVMMTGFSTLMSAWDRYRWRTIGLVSGFMIVQVLLKLTGMALEGLEPLTYLTLLSAYEPEVHVRMVDSMPGAFASLWVTDAESHVSQWGPLAQDGLLLGVGAVCFLGASMIFNRRDLPAPL